MLDTNIWISSLLLPQSVPGQIVKAWQQAMFDVVISLPILEELRKVLAYPKIKNRLAIPPTEVEEYLTFIRFFTEEIVLEPTLLNRYANEVRDINDVPILATLIASQAKPII